MSYGGENGFNQAIELASEALANVKFIQEKKLIGKCFVCRKSYLFPSSILVAGDVPHGVNVWCHCMFLFAGKYFDEISQDTGKYCFGVDDTLKALEMGAVEILIVWENMETMRYVLKNHQTDGKSRAPLVT